MPPARDKIALGKYLVFGLECWPCHSGDFKKMNMAEGDRRRKSPYQTHGQSWSTMRNRSGVILPVLAPAALSGRPA